MLEERSKEERLMKSMKGVFRLIMVALFGVVILACFSGRANAISLMEDRLRIHGYVENQTAWRLQDGVNEKGKLSRCRTTLQVEIAADLSETVKFNTILRGYYDAAWDLQSSINQAPKDWDSVPNGIGMKEQFDAREYHIRKYWDNFMVKVGRQQIVWGESDLLRMADIINPLDLSWRINLQAWEDIRIPVRAIDFVYQLPGEHDFKFEFVAVPEDFRPNKVAAPGANWDPMWDNPQGTQGMQLMWKAMERDLSAVNDDGLSNFQGGLRAMGKFGDWDTSLFYYYSLAQTAVATFNTGFNPFAPPSLDNYPMNFKWPHIQTVGATFNMFEGYTGTVFRGECAYTIDQPFTQDAKDPMLKAMGMPDPDYATNNTFACMLGFDRPTFIKALNSTKTFFISGQVFQKWITDADDYSISTGLGQEGRDDYQCLGTLTINTEYWDGKIVPQIAAIYDFTASAALFWPQIQYMPTYDISIILGATWIWAHKPTASGLGPFEMDDEVFMELRYSF